MIEIRIKLLLLITTFFFSFAPIVADIPHPIFEQSSETKLATDSKDFALFYENNPKPFSAKSWYELSQLNIKANNLDTALNALLQSIKIDPNLIEAHIQMGYVYLMLQNYECALKTFTFVIDNFPCNKFVYSGLEEVAHYYEKEEATRPLALTLYQKLLKCLPENSDYYLYIGRLFNWMDRSRCAEEYLNKCLELVPDYYDAAAILASIYIKEELYYEAENLYYRFPNNSDAMAGLAKIAFLQKKYKRAQYLQQSILWKDPNDSNAQRGLARSLYNQQLYRKSRRLFLPLINNDPCDDHLLREYGYSVKPYTNIAIVPEFSYTKAKENDRSLKKPVVRNLYVMGNLNVYVPLNDQWRIDAKAFFFRQKEKDIYPPTTGNNYNVYMSGTRITSHVYHSRVWRWDLSASLFKAWGQGKEFYPFSDTTSFEPATYAIYNDDRHLIVVGGNYESFVIKNFSNQRSELLRFVYTEGRYGYKFKDLSFEPEINGWLSWSFYNDSIHNRKELQSFFLQSKIPGASKAITLTYLAEHSGFAELSRNYFSYERQWLNVLGARLHHDISTKSYIELLYEQRWRSTRNLFLPVGDTVFVAKKLFIRGHRPSIKIGHRYRDKVTIEVSGHYYRDTFPYRDYGFKTNILWYF